MFPLTPQHERTTTMYWMRPGVDNYTNKKSSESESLKLSSIKHDLARSCFQLWPKICDEGDKISREKNWQGASRDSFFSKFKISVALDLDFNIKCTYKNATFRPNFRDLAPSFGP